ncbi:transmembrane protein 64 isoform X1 [Plutella xylostella]|uniref:transmembrane protein 64 isoform X1 n=1 Tax=Plutella xylostella TaxID=51655 RepID=UPI0005D04CCF|nr:transmembrane protein 64 isoform X1 [Plutella xylostella]
MELVDVEECQPDPTATARKKGLWAKINNKTTYSYLFNIVISILLLTCLILVLYFFKEYLKTILYWVDNQDPWIVFLLFMGLFLVVSFPVTIGYLVLIITSGYLFGILKGFGTVLVSANFGVAVAHFTLKALRKYLPLDTLLKNETARALLKVISGPQAFKIVFFARLTPIPFGLQNTIFAVSDVRGCGYHLATCLGLMPAQLINVYLGSTLRSMHDVLHESHATGYVVFALQILIGITLMVWVVQKARKELTLAIMQAELGRETISSSSDSSVS